MKWYRSGTGCSRQSLAQALQQFGDQYSQLAQALLRGDLEESRHQPVSDGTLQTQKLTPSPSHSSFTPSPPPTSPLPDSPLTRAPQAPRTPFSVSLRLRLSPRSRKLKAGFTFDEDCRSSDSLPKFLSTRSLFTTSPDSPHVSGGHTPRSQPVIQRHLSLSDISSGSTSSSWPATHRSGRASQHDSAYTRQRKSSLPHGDPVETSGRGYNLGRRGSRERQHGGGGWRKSSLHSDEILMSLTEYDRGILATGTLSQQNTSENVVRMRAGGSGSVDLGGETLGWSEDPRPGGHTTAPHRYRVIGSRTGPDC
ncbi:hypothetical protein GBAR_LOCUS23583 [Geodia barretti]|nr:hypothetical protein GBAR_LOCUS23583 [Geodia barretti]